MLFRNFQFARLSCKLKVLLKESLSLDSNLGSDIHITGINLRFYSGYLRLFSFYFRFSLTTTMKTAIIMSSMPKIPLIVEVSWKTTIPIKTAVNGSIAPKIEVTVGPICLIALTKAILEIAVAGKARPRI